MEEYYEAFNARDLEKLRSLLADDVEVRVDAGRLSGAEATLAYAEGVMREFPGLGILNRTVLRVGADRVVSQYELKMIDRWDPSVADWQLDGLFMEVMTVGDGKIVALHSFYDSAPTDRIGSVSIPSRFEAAQIAQQQGALRRVATRVAEGGSLQEVLAAVTWEVQAQYGVLDVRIVTGDEDDGEPVSAHVVRVPIMVGGDQWGTLEVSSEQGQRVSGEITVEVAGFADLLGIAVSNARARAELLASRARVVASADRARRQLQRDVHDAAQQRLVHTIITLKLALAALEHDPAEAADLLHDALAHAERANSELREIVHGVLPAALSAGGLRMGIESLTADLDLPVRLEITSARFAIPLETTAYFIVAEALTNVIKHAQAASAVIAIAESDSDLDIVVSDDGIGGADIAEGTGIIGIRDRVEAADGFFELTTEPGRGTDIHVVLPIRDGSEALSRHESG